MELKTLFILFYFPPFSRVGGRRWAKHLKYFNRFGSKFKVLAGDFEGKSPWDDDVKEYESLISRVPVKVYYPYYKRCIPKNIIQKIKWKSSLLYNNYLAKKYVGNFWDDSRGYEVQFYNKAVEIIRAQEINHICLSVGPFAYSSVLLKLKTEFPTIKITLDFRDYWHDTFENLDADKINYELNLKKRVLSKVDLVLAPNNEMCDFFNNKYNVTTYMLPHCIDEEYLNISTKKNNAIRKTLTFVYGGNLYTNMDQYILKLINLIKSFENLGFSIVLKIFTMQPNYINLFIENNITYEIAPNLPTKNFIDLVLTSDALILLRPDWSPNAFSTKFFEYVAMKKPIIYLGPKGNVNDYILKYDLGFVINSEEVKQTAIKFIDNIETHTIPNANYNLSEHTFEFQTKKLIHYWDSFYA